MAVTTTTNYGFSKPDADEFISPSPFNDNFDILDEQLKEVADTATAAASKTVDIDTTVTEGSSNPVSSGAVYTSEQAIASRVSTLEAKTSALTLSDITDFTAITTEQLDAICV